MINDAPAAFRLTEREKELLILLVSGLPGNAIARTLGIAFRTVISHREHIMKKLKINSVGELRGTAIQLGFIQPER